LDPIIESTNAISLVDQYIELLKPQYALVCAAIVNTIVESFKRSIRAGFPALRKPEDGNPTRQQRAFKFALGVAPLAIGVIVGESIVPPGEIPPWAIGLVSGGGGGYIYNLGKTLKPNTSAQ
jgi:hypothetical protein